MDKISRKQWHDSHTLQCRKSVGSKDREFKAALRKMKKRKRTTLQADMWIELKYDGVCGHCRSKLEAKSIAWLRPLARQGQRLCCINCHNLDKPQT